MSTLREAAEQARELLRLADKFSKGWHDGIKIDATDVMLLVEIAAALEQQEQEPVASIRKWHENGEQQAEILLWCDAVDSLPDGEHAVYTAPPRRKWVKLTDEEIDDLSRAMVKGNKSVNWLSRAIEAALKEKNT